MSHNPYRPPVAAVADVEPEALFERPRNVTLAVRLLWVGIAVGVPGAIYSIMTQPLPGGISRGFLIGIAAVSWSIAFAIVYWIFGAVAKGRNWARILNAVGLGLNALIWASMGKATLAAMAANGSQWNMAVYLVQLVIYTIAVVLTFTPNSRPWFAPR